MIRDDTDDEARKAILCTWRQVEPDVLPAWVAEMDYALAPVIEEALVDAVRTGITGYPSFDDGGELGPAYAPQLDLDGLAALFRAGARTLLTQPHNPWGRVFTRPELEEIRDVVVAHGARGISDEIHAPLVLPGAEHVSYLAIAGTADHAIALVAASKAFNTPGARARSSWCRTTTPAPGSSASRWPATTPGRAWAWSPPWRRTPTATRGWPPSSSGSTGSARCSRTRSPSTSWGHGCVRSRAPTWPGWTCGHAGTPTRAAVALEKGRVRLAPGHDYHLGLDGHVRLTIATSPERLTRIIERVAGALLP